MDTGSLPIMTYGGRHYRREPCAREFYPHRPASPSLRRHDPSGPSPAPRPWTQMPRRAAADLVVLCRRPPHLALGCLPVLARRPFRRGGPLGPDRHPARLRRVAPPAQRRPGGDLPRPLRRRPQRLAADLVLIPYHGQPLADPDEIYRSQAKSGTSHFHAYATLYVIHHGYRFTVALTAVGRRRTAGGGPQAPAPPSGRRRRPLPLAAAGSRLLQRGGDPLSPGGPAPVPDAGDLSGPQARRSAGAQRDQRLLDLGEERLRAPTPCTMPTSGRPGSRSVSSAATTAASGDGMASSG